MLLRRTSVVRAIEVDHIEAGRCRLEIEIAAPSTFGSGRDIRERHEEQRILPRAVSTNASSVIGCPSAELQHADALHLRSGPVDVGMSNTGPIVRHFSDAGTLNDGSRVVLQAESRRFSAGIGVGDLAEGAIFFRRALFDCCA